MGSGHGGLRTSIQESYRKYDVADWLEELARCHISFKMNAAQNFSLLKVDSLVVNYVKSRRSHFRVLFRQALGIYLFPVDHQRRSTGNRGWLVLNPRADTGAGCRL
jgi:ATP-binding cassette subfamily B protein